MKAKLRSKIEEGFFRDMWKETVWMYGYVRRFKFAVLVHIVLGAAATIMSLLSSIAMKKLIDVVTGFAMGEFVSAACFMVLLMLGSAVLQAAASRIAAKINIRVQNGIQAEVYDRMLRTDWQSLERFRSGDLINRLNGDVSAIAGGVTGLIPGLVTGGGQFLGSLVIILFYDPVMALIALIGAPIYVLSSRMLVKRMREYNKRMKEISSQVMSFHEDSFRNLTTIKSFGIMDGFRDRMHGMQGTYRDAMLEYNKFSVVTSLVMSVIGLIISTACFGWGVYRLWTNRITFGTMTMFIQLTNMLRGGFSGLVSLVPAFISVTTSAGRIMAVIELPEEKGARDTANIPERCEVHLENVSFTYADGEEPVLENVDFEARYGEAVALCGASGEGKTTLIRLILGLVCPDSGRAYLRGDGRETEISAATRAAFSYVPQGNTILAGTIADNLRLLRPEATEEEMWEALRLACADAFVAKLPKGLDSDVGEMGHGFSEGQAQRLAVARALMQRSPILILDEATAALDEATERTMLTNIAESGAARTCIVISHRSATTALCDRKYMLDGTRLKEVGTP